MANLDDTIAKLIRVNELCDVIDARLDSILEKQARLLDQQRGLTPHEAITEQECPSCKGKGWLRGQGMMIKCRGCNGTGHS